MPFVPDAESPSGQATGYFQPDKSVSGFASNLWDDVKENASGIGHLVQGLAEHPIDTVTNAVKGAPGMIVNEGKRLGIGELLTGHPINAVGKLADAAYDKPLTTGMEVLPAVGAVGKALGIGGEAARGAEMAEQAANAGKAGAVEDAAAAATKAAPAAAEVGEAAAPAAVAAPEAAAVPGITASGLVDEAAGRAKGAVTDKLGELKSYATGKYEQAAKQPGWTNTVADYLHQHSQNMAVKQLGASPMQARQLGEDATRAIGQYALDKGIVNPKVGSIGMKEMTESLNKAAGKTLGALRKEADALRDPVSHPIDVLQEVRSKLDPKYTRGVHSGEAGSYAKALEDVEDTAPTHEDLSQLATKLNHAANEANKLKQPHTAFTDVANTVSDLNNERIKALLGPAKAAQYEQALREFGVTKKIQEFLKRRSSREISGRIGPGGITRELGQKFMDELGYKAGAKITNKMSQRVLENPSLAKSLPSMFKEFINQVEELGEEPGAMAHGGIVGESELNDFLSSKYEKGALNK